MDSESGGFVGISEELSSRFPGLKVAYLLLHNAQVTTTPPRQKKRARAAEKELRSSFDKESIFGEPNIASWLQLYRAMGLDITKVQPPQLELSFSVLQGRNIPKINNIVDAANIFAVTSKCPVGAFDLDRIAPPVTLRLSSQGETYIPLFSSEAETVPPDEIVYADKEGIFSRYSKDADRTKITEDTRNVLYVADGTPYTEKDVLLQALAGLSEILNDVAGENVSIEKGYVEA